MDSAIWQNHNATRFWVWCLMKATHCEYQQGIGYQIVNLTPGQFVFGRATASEETGLSEKQVRNCINFLKESGAIRVISASKFSILTICNWGDYQSILPPMDDEGASKGQPEGPAEGISRGHKQEHEEHLEHEETCSPPKEPAGGVPVPEPVKTKPRHRDRFADAFKAAFDAKFPEPYTWQGGDFPQLAKFRKAHPTVTPEKFVGVAQECWESDYMPKAALAIRSVCTEWATLSATLWKRNQSGVAVDPYANIGTI